MVITADTWRNIVPDMINMLKISDVKCVWSVQGTENKGERCVGISYKTSGILSDLYEQMRNHQRALSLYMICLMLQKDVLVCGVKNEVKEAAKMILGESIEKILKDWKREIETGCTDSGVGQVQLTGFADGFDKGCQNFKRTHG